MTYPKGKRAHNFKPELGKRYGRLLVIEETERGPKRLVVCQCDCGNTTKVRPYDLRRGSVISCRCYQSERTSERNMIHGHSDTRTFNIWKGIKKRISNPNDTAYKNYGGRGIDIDPRWAKDFMCFLNDVGHPPTDQHSIERIRNEYGYWPWNCKWATSAEQAANTRRNIIVEYDGIKAPLGVHADRLGIIKSTLYARVQRGMAPDVAIKKGLQQ